MKRKNRILIVVALIFTVCAVLCLTIACSDKKTYTVIFDSRGGSEVETVTVVEGKKLTFPSVPKKIGYKFDGWYTDINFNEKWDFSARKIVNDITLYAKWKIEEGEIISVENAIVSEFDILMIVDEEVENASIADTVFLTGDTKWKMYYDITGQKEIPTKIAAQINGKLDKGDNVFYILTLTGDGDPARLYTLTVHRKYPITVEFYWNGDFLGSVEKYTYDTVSSSDVKKIALEAYTIDGWKDDNGNDFFIGETVIKRDMILYAVVTPNVYTIMCNPMGGTMKVSTQMVKYGEEYSLAIPQRTGYNFLYWYAMSENGEEIKTTTSTGAALGKYLFADDLIVYAKWKAIRRYNHLSIEGVPHGGGNILCNGESGTDFTVESDKRITITVVTNPGYTFLGLYDGDEKVSVDGEMRYTFLMPAKEKRLKAKWAKVMLEKNIEEAGTVGGLDGTYFPGDEATITATTNDGYIFVGWFDGDILLSDEPAYTFILPAESKIYTAFWKADEK